MSEENNTVDVPTTDPVIQEQNTEVQEDQGNTSKTAKRFEKLLQQRNAEAKKAEDNGDRASELQAELDEMKGQAKKEKPDQEDVSGLVRKELDSYFNERKQSDQKELQEIRQREELFTNYPEAKSFESDLKKLAQAHPTVPYE